MRGPAHRSGAVYTRKGGAGRELKLGGCGRLLVLNAGPACCQAVAVVCQGPHEAGQGHASLRHVNAAHTRSMQRRQLMHACHAPSKLDMHCVHTQVHMPFTSAQTTTQVGRLHRARSHTHTRTFTHTRVHTHTHTCTRTHTRTRTHTPARTCTDQAGLARASAHAHTPGRTFVRTPQNAHATTRTWQYLRAPCTQSARLHLENSSILPHCSARSASIRRLCSSVMTAVYFWCTCTGRQSVRQAGNAQS